MADFQRLADVETVAAVNDDDTVLIEQGGEVKRAPKNQLGAGGEAGKPMVVFGREFDTALDDYVYVVKDSQVSDPCAYLVECVKNGIVPNCVWANAGLICPLVYCVDLVEDPYEGYCECGFLIQYGEFFMIRVSKTNEITREGISFTFN